RPGAGGSGSPHRLPPHAPGQVEAGRAPVEQVPGQPLTRRHGDDIVEVTVVELVTQMDTELVQDGEVDHESSRVQLWSCDGYFRRVRVTMQPGALVPVREREPVRRLEGESLPDPIHLSHLPGCARVLGGVDHAGQTERLPALDTRTARPAMTLATAVTRPRLRKRHRKLSTERDDLRLGQVHERSQHGEP